LYQRSNPLPLVTRATTPTMVIHGTNDRTVPPEQARTFFRALRANGVPTKLVWLPRTGHWPAEPGLAYEAARHQKEWFDRWVRGR
jgi:dipeptidyl aminopeptidase/acylaminoacyl peptidase